MAAPALHDLPLDQRLVEIALDLLANEGLEGLSLRRLAREAGVSHGAPLRHFASLSVLRAEVAARGFARLSAAIDESSAALAPGAGALARLAAAGRAYTRVALANPSLFALMFRPEDLDIANEAYIRESSGAFDHLQVHVRAAQDTGWHADRDTRVLASSVWAAVHGLASLWAQGAFLGPVPDASIEDVLATTLELVLGTRQGDPT
jgi:AcrR family transcriptional regulator